MSREPPSWAEQWGTGGIGDMEEDEYLKGDKKETGSSNKMASAKAAASAGFGKAKAAALVGAMKVKSGTSSGIKWVKNQYQKRSSK
ncbi:hypothetical protein RJ641_001927 [Dillenia turbinata]|uniref:Uncharacterized protein n=1 Tax=Dillenia turbinata TaxID=194707 RepID=A0AAN8ZEZ6_9MAGN